MGKGDLGEIRGAVSTQFCRGEKGEINLGEEIKLLGRYIYGEYNHDIEHDKNWAVHQRRMYITRGKSGVTMLASVTALKKSIQGE